MMAFDFQLSASDLFPCHRRPEVWAVTPGAFLPLRVGGVCGADGERAGVRCSSHHLGFMGEEAQLFPSKFHFPSSPVIFGNLRSSLGVASFGRILTLSLAERSCCSAGLADRPNLVKKGEDFFHKIRPPDPLIKLMTQSATRPVVFLAAAGCRSKLPAGGSAGTQFASASNLRHGRCARSGPGLNRKRRREESLIPTGVFPPLPPLLKLSKGLILLGKSVDKGRPQPLAFGFTVGVNACLKLAVHQVLTSPLEAPMKTKVYSCRVVSRCRQRGGK